VAFALQYASSEERCNGPEGQTLAMLPGRQARTRWGALRRLSKRRSLNRDPRAGDEAPTPSPR